MHLRHGKCCDFATMALKRAGHDRFDLSLPPLTAAAKGPKTGRIGKEILIFQDVSASFDRF
jgi:hypothetical protein